MWTFGDRCACGEPATLLVWSFHSQAKEGDVSTSCDLCGHRMLAAIERKGSFYENGRGTFLAVYPPVGSKPASSPEWPPYTTAYDIWVASGRPKMR